VDKNADYTPNIAQKVDHNNNKRSDPISLAKNSDNINTEISSLL